MPLYRQQCCIESLITIVLMDSSTWTNSYVHFETVRFYAAIHNLSPAGRNPFGCGRSATDSFLFYSTRFLCVAVVVLFLLKKKKRTENWQVWRQLLLDFAIDNAHWLEMKCNLLCIHWLSFSTITTFIRGINNKCVCWMGKLLCLTQGTRE